MPTINPYLNFNGTTEQAFEFYRSVFGGEFCEVMRYRDIQMDEPVSDEDAGKIMHISLPIGPTCVLMGTDTLASMGRSCMQGTNISLSVEAADKAEADRLFDGLAAGGTIEMPMQEMFWGAYWGMLRDKFGIQWMVNCPLG